MDGWKSPQLEGNGGAANPWGSFGVRGEESLVFGVQPGD
jgi:hypothetical protein